MTAIYRRRVTLMRIVFRDQIARLRDAMRKPAGEDRSPPAGSVNSAPHAPTRGFPSTRFHNQLKDRADDIALI